MRSWNMGSHFLGWASKPHILKEAGAIEADVEESHALDSLGRVARSGETVRGVGKHHHSSPGSGLADMDQHSNAVEAYGSHHRPLFTAIALDRTYELVVSSPVLGPLRRSLRARRSR